jgi:hypothetical protein
MKKAILFFTTIGLLLSTAFTSCEKDGDSADILESISERRHMLAQETAQKIMDCLINKDEEGLYSLMSQEAQEFHLTKEQIQEAIDFFDGEIISYGLPERAGLISSYISSEMKKVYTDSGNMYEILFDCIFVDDNPRNDLDGVRSIIIGLRDEHYKSIEYVVIGLEDSEPNVVP